MLHPGLQTIGTLAIQISRIYSTWQNYPITHIFRISMITFVAGTAKAVVNTYIDV